MKNLQITSEELNIYITKLEAILEELKSYQNPTVTPFSDPPPPPPPPPHH